MATCEAHAGRTGVGTSSLKKARSELPRIMPGPHVPLVAKPWLMAEIVLSYARIRRLMRRKSLDSVVAEIGRQRSAIAANTAEAAETRMIARRLGNAVDRTLQVLPTDARCLSQSLVVLWLLGKRGIPATLVIGTQSEPRFQAHAWVEHGGRPVLPPLDFYDSRLVELPT